MLSFLQTTPSDLVVVENLYNFDNLIRPTGQMGLDLIVTAPSMCVMMK
jgi:hypothetical protein